MTLLSLIPLHVFHNIDEYTIKSYCINSRNPPATVLESADTLENYINLYFLRSEPHEITTNKKLDFYTAGNPSWIRRGLEKYFQESSANVSKGWFGDVGDSSKFGSNISEVTSQRMRNANSILLKISMSAFLKRLLKLIKQKSAITCQG